MDGNKRTAVYVIEDMLEVNGIYIAIPPYVVKYTVQAALDSESPGFMGETEFTAKIAKLCSSNKSVAFFKKVRYEIVPDLWLRWSFYWAEKMMKAVNEVLDHPEKSPKFVVNFYNKFSKTEFIKMLYNRPIDWLAAGELKIFLLTMRDDVKWENEGFPKEAQFLLFMDEDY